MKDRTEIVFILDKSGSMHGLEADTIGGFNAVLAKHKAMEGEAVVSTVLFSDTPQVVCDQEDIQRVCPLTRKEYCVGGCTALLDAVGGAIDHTTKMRKLLPKARRAKNTIFVIATDGMENASRSYTYDDVRRRIAKKRKKGWEFIFLGANMDAAAEASRLGIAADRAASYIADEQGSELMYAAMGAATCHLRGRGSLDDSWAEAIAQDAASR